MPLTQEQEQYLAQWYDKTKEAVLKELREQNERIREEDRRTNHENPDRNYMPTANLSMDVASHYVSERERAQQVHHSYIPFMSGHTQEIMQFLVGEADRVADEIRQGQLDALIYQKMLDEAKGPERAPYRAAIEQKGVEAQNRTVERGTTYEAIDTVLWKLEGRIPSDVTLISGERYQQMTQQERSERKYSPVQQGSFMEIMEHAPAMCAGMEFDEFLERQPIRQVMPGTLTMNFTDYQMFNSREFLEHMASAKKQPTLREKDYAMSIYDATFGGAFDKGQKKLLAQLGMDEFDLITIEGRTVNELFADKYKDMEPQRRNELLRCEVVAAVMGSEKKVAFGRIKMNEQGEPEIAGTSALKPEGNLHDPKPTLGQRFLNFLHIKKYVPLSQKMAQAGSPERAAAAREQAQQALEVAHPQDKLTRRMIKGLYEKNNEANCGPRVSAEFKEFFGKDHDNAINELPGFAQGAEIGLRNQLSRPSTGVGLVYARLLQEGHRLADIMDPDKLQDEKSMAGRQIAEQMKTPEGIGTLLADATKTYANLDMRAEFAYALGRPLDTPEALEKAMTGEKEMATTLPMIRKFYSASREVHQCVNAMYNFSDMTLLEKPDEATREVLTAGKNEATKKAFGAFCNHITTEDLEARSRVSNFNNALMRGNRIDALRDYYLSEDYVEGRAFNPQFDELKNTAVKAAVARDVLTEAARNMGATIGTTEVPEDSYYAKEAKATGLDAYTPEQLTGMIRSGKNSPEGQAIMNSVLNPEEKAAKNAQEKEGNTAFRINREAAARARIAERRTQLEAERAERTEREREMSQEIDAAAKEVRTRPRAKSVHMESVSFASLLEEDEAESGKSEKKARRQSMDLSKSETAKSQKDPSQTPPTLKKNDELTKGK